MNRYWQQGYRMPAGAAAGIPGPQGLPQPVQGLPPGGLPGYANALDAYYHQQQVGGYFPPMPQVSPQFQCEAEYLSRVLCACMMEGLVNVQQVARLPSHRDVPYNGICFKRHAGTGAAGSSDPPIALPAVGAGGAYTLLVDFTVNSGNNGVLRGVGVDLDPETSRGEIDVRVQVNGQVVPPFDRQNGAVVAATDGSAWLGFPFTIADPDRDICVPLFPNDVVTLEARNSFGVAPIDAAGMLLGWTYMPTLQTSDRTIRGTLTDQR
ncbi:MAG: hypothetical protein Q8Q14_09145 [Gemmatimonadales bacterium]|nr:hypothetical protein [Gemmatimonadales bacterium]